jgi:hypothetical protein
MPRPIAYLPLGITLATIAGMLLYGPIAQFDAYHDFADRSAAFGIPHFADVLSNIGFAVVGSWGWLGLRAYRQHPALAAGWAGYRLFFVGLILTALGSSYYHLAPDDARLVWDRVPIALACGGLLAAVWAETHARQESTTPAAWLALFAVGSVAWWHFSAQHGVGDLRPYLLLQSLPLVLVPLWQTIDRSPRGDRVWFGVALFVYACAKLAELNDHPLLNTLGWMSGHTLKHLLATVAAGLLVGRLAGRVHTPRATQSAAAGTKTPAGVIG